MTRQFAISYSDVADLLGHNFDAMPSARLVLGIARSETIERHQCDILPDDSLGGNGQRVYHPLLVV